MHPIQEGDPGEILVGIEFNDALSVAEQAVDEFVAVARNRPMKFSTSGGIHPSVQDRLARAQILFARGPRLAVLDHAVGGAVDQLDRGQAS